MARDSRKKDRPPIREPCLTSENFPIQELRNRVLRRIPMSEELPEEHLMQMIRQEVLSYSGEHPLDLGARRELEKNVYNALRKLDILQDLLDDEDCTEIMINGFQNIFVERRGRVEKVELAFCAPEKLDDIVQQMVSANNQIINASSPIVDTRLSDGSRVNIVIPPIALNGPVVSIRRFPKNPYTMEDLISFGSLSREVAEFLRKLVVSGYNIFISGGTGSGKTTLLNALTGYIPKGERVITIEDAAELQIIGVENLIRLESRGATLEGKLEITIRDLVKNALRMRPDRIIVGECRGGEALEVLQACNTGHDGSLSTGHANSCRDMISRLETMTLMGMDLPIPAIRRQIASAIDILVHVGRMRDRSRKLIEICEVTGMKDGEVELQCLYCYNQETGNWEEEAPLQNREKLYVAGLE